MSPNRQGLAAHTEVSHRNRTTTWTGIPRVLRKPSLLKILEMCHQDHWTDSLGSANWTGMYHICLSNMREKKIQQVDWPQRLHFNLPLDLHKCSASNFPSTKCPTYFPTSLAPCRLNPVWRKHAELAICWTNSIPDLAPSPLQNTFPKWFRRFHVTILLWDVAKSVSNSFYCLLLCAWNGCRCCKRQAFTKQGAGRDETSFESCVLTLELNEGKGIWIKKADYGRWTYPSKLWQSILILTFFKTTRKIRLSKQMMFILVALGRVSHQPKACVCDYACVCVCD